MSEENNEPVVDENNEPEKIVQGSLAAALGVISPTAAKEVEDESKETPAAEVAEVAEDAPKPASVEPVASDDDVLPDDIVDSEPEPEPVKISAKNIRVRRREPTPTIEPVKEPEPEPAKEPESEPEPDFSHLGKRERDTIDLLKFGETANVAEKGIVQKVVKYYEERNALVQKLQAENIDDEDYDLASDRELMRWKKLNPPPIDVDTLDSIREERIVHRAEERAAKKFQPEVDRARQELEDYKRKLEADKVRPTVEGKVSQFSDSVLQGMPEDIAKVMSSESDWSKIEEALPIEAPIVKSVLNEYADQAEVFLNVVNGITPPSGSDPIQSKVRNFMFEQADLLISKGKTLRGGKQFVHPARFKGEDGTWTFSADHMLQMLQKKAQNVATRRIKSEQSRIDSIIARRSKSASAQNSDGEGAPVSTSVKSSPSGGSHGESTKGGSGLLSALGL